MSYKRLPNDVVTTTVLSAELYRWLGDWCDETGMKKRVFIARAVQHERERVEQAIDSRHFGITNDEMRRQAQEGLVDDGKADHVR